MPLLVIDARMIHASGIGVYPRQIIPFLSSHFEVYLLGKKEELKNLELSQYPIISSNSDIYTIKEQVELLIKVPPCDIFWSPQYNIPLLPVRAKKRVVTIHDTYHLAYKHTLSLAQKAYASLVMHAAVKFSHKVVTVSSYSKEEIKKYTQCPEEKISIIYNGVDHHQFAFDFTENEKKALKSVYPNLPEKYILFVGNMKPHKNLLTLLKAYVKLSDSALQEYGIVVVGKKEGFITPDQEVYHFLQKEPGLEHRILFTGFVPDDLLAFFYKCASLFVFPSQYEGFGLPPLEAMAGGCPVIASSAASIPEICGAAALYFNPLDEQELRQQMEKVLEDKTIQKELKLKGFQQAEKYNWESSAQQHIQLFKDLLNTD